MLADYENWDRQNLHTERFQIWRAVVDIMKENGTFVDTFPPRHPIDILMDERRKESR